MGSVFGTLGGAGGRWQRTALSRSGVSPSPRAAVRQSGCGNFAPSELTAGAQRRMLAARRGVIQLGLVWFFVLVVFREIAGEQFGQGVERRLGVGPVGLDHQLRALLGGQRQQVEDALAVDALVVFDHFDLGLKLVRQSGRSGRPDARACPAGWSPRRSRRHCFYVAHFARLFRLASNLHRCAESISARSL